MFYHRDGRRFTTPYNKISGRYSGYRHRIKENLNKIKGRHYLIAMLLGAIILSLFFVNGNSFTGFVVNSLNEAKSNILPIFVILVILALGLILSIYRKNILEFAENVRTKHPSNSIKGLINKKVYCGEANYLGRVDEVFLGKNKIDSLKIKLDKKQKFKIKGIIVKYKNVESVGEIVIVDGNILEKLNS